MEFVRHKCVTHTYQILAYSHVQKHTLAFNFGYCIIVPKITYSYKCYDCHNNSDPDVKSARLTCWETDSLTVQSTHTP